MTTSQFRYTTSEGNRPIVTNTLTPASEHDVAQTFADRLARREFGRRGRAVTLRADSYTPEGSQVNYESFIGLPSGDRTYAGRNIHFTVYRARLADKPRSSDLVLVRSDTGDGGWSLHPAGSTDEQIASGDALCWLSGPAQWDEEEGDWDRPNAHDYEEAERRRLDQYGLGTLRQR